ncbi:DUF3667 domain-containing protein [Terricaulis silvestris]|uniref:DUF3667 domain-containing protein n=1 Tax=Terricaulis silvestris TaxID=2686094 RepID=A0A6I6MP87_9CAUL|nr:DUF3667 domain-containing protein [Terricaulis silvestris]QGZ94597.1 hypothetical protein DSM104635_01417 [Terricaulis silvestris]
MSGELEAAGAMATAGLVAGAIEGREGQSPGEGACLNCGAQLTGAYCSACGQAAHAHRSLIHVLEEFLHGIFHFDTKVWRTLPMAIFRPGTLTRNYVYGKRARYLSPLAFFLLTVFFMFAVFAFAGGPPMNVTESGTVAEAQAELAEAREDLATAERELQEVLANPDPDQPAGLEESLARQAIGLAQAEVAREAQSLRRAQAREAAAAQGEDQVVAPVAVGAPEPAASAVAPPAPAAPAEDAATPPPLPGSVQVEVDSVDSDGGPLNWQDAVREMAEADDFVVIQGWDSFNQRIRDQLRNPDLAAYKIQEAAAKFSFLLVPISLPFLALLFLWKRGVTLYDHVVFSLYELSFVSLLFVLMVSVARVDALMWLVPMLVLFGVPVHTFFHLKGAYALGWFSAIWRTFFMMIFATIALCIFLIAIVILGLAG